MGMIAFYAGLIMGALVGIVFMLLMSKLVPREGIQKLPKGGANPI